MVIFVHIIAQANRFIKCAFFSVLLDGDPRSVPNYADCFASNVIKAVKSTGPQSLSLYIIAPFENFTLRMVSLLQRAVNYYYRH